MRSSPLRRQVGRFGPSTATWRNPFPPTSSPCPRFRARCGTRRWRWRTGTSTGTAASISTPSIGGCLELPKGPSRPRRQHHNPAAREKPLPRTGPHPVAEDPRGPARRRVGEAPHQGPDPRAIHERRRLRTRSAGRWGRRPRLLRQVAGRPDARRKRDDGRSGARSTPADAQPVKGRVGPESGSSPSRLLVPPPILLCRSGNGEVNPARGAGFRSTRTLNPNSAKIPCPPHFHVTLDMILDAVPRYLKYKDRGRRPRWPV